MRQAGLTAIQSVLGDPILRLKQAKDVRWLSHQAAVESLRCSLVFVLTSLDREASECGEPTASGLLNFMKKKILLLLCHYLLTFFLMFVSFPALFSPVI